MKYVWLAALAALTVCGGDTSAEGGKNKKKPAEKAKPADAMAANAPAPVAPPEATAGKIKLEVVARKLKRPVLVTFAPGDAAGRLFIVEQVGKIRIFDGGAVVETPFLDIASQVSRGNEQGLLGLAFHPKYKDNGRFFINYTDGDGDTHVVEYKVSADKNVADAKSARELLKVDQPYSNHNGGHLEIGPDGWLWIGLGDGGAANDPKGNGQNDASQLGKMLRLDPDAKTPAAQIHMKGLRNPWRYSFDAKTGDLYIGDVGQDKWEEVDVLAAADAAKGGQNFGWNAIEGLHCFKDKSCKPAGFTLPVVEYAHGDGTGCSVTGGRVYRGAALPELDGIYFYADYCTAALRSFRWSGGKLSDHWDWKKALDPDNKLATISSFGVDAAGELYILSLDGAIWRFARR